MVLELQFDLHCPGCLYSGESALLLEGFEGAFVASLELVDLGRNVEHLIFHRRPKESAENLGMELGTSFAPRMCVSERFDSAMCFSITSHPCIIESPYCSLRNSIERTSFSNIHSLLFSSLLAKTATISFPHISSLSQSDIKLPTTSRPLLR